MIRLGPHVFVKLGWLGSNLDVAMLFSIPNVWNGTARPYGLSDAAGPQRGSCCRYYVSSDIAATPVGVCAESHEQCMSPEHPATI